MNDIVINNETEYEIINICEEMTFEILNYLQLDNCSLSINLVSDEEIVKINKEYRQKDTPTDVITFSYEDDENFNALFEVRELGDIFIAVDYVFANSKKYGHSMAREFSFVLAHGILHTLGYDHNTKQEETKMFSKQEEIISNIIGKGSELNEIFN